MNYLEITILFLFIGFLIVFYLSNFIYNKCLSEKTQESFMDAQARASLLAKQQAEAAEAAAGGAALRLLGAHQPGQGAGSPPDPMAAANQPGHRGQRHLLRAVCARGGCRQSIQLGYRKLRAPGLCAPQCRRSVAVELLQS